MLFRLIEPVTCKNTSRIIQETDLNWRISLHKVVFVYLDHVPLLVFKIAVLHVLDASGFGMIEISEGSLVFYSNFSKY